MSTDLNQLTETLSTLTILELAELSKKLEEKWGVSAMAFASAAPAEAEAGVRDEVLPADAEHHRLPIERKAEA